MCRTSCYHFFSVKYGRRAVVQRLRNRVHIIALFLSNQLSLSWWKKFCKACKVHGTSDSYSYICKVQPDGTHRLLLGLWAFQGEGITLIFWSSCRCEIEHEMGEMRPRQLHRETRRGRSEYYVKAEFRKLPSAAALVEKLNIKGRDILKCISWQKLSEAGAALDIAFGSRSQ